MTTSWAWLVRGEVARAAAASMGGLLAGMLAIGISAWTIVTAVRGRWWIGLPNEKVFIAVGLIFATITLADWCHKLWASVQ